MVSHNIYSNEKLKSLIDEKGYIKDDIVIRGDNIKTLQGVKKVYGNIGIDSNSLSSLGSLNYVKGDFWITRGDKLKSLHLLERVGGDLSLRYSNIKNLGNLWRVGGKLNLRDTEIEDLSNLKYVKTLFLPKSIENLDISHIEFKKLRYWKKVVVIDSQKKQFKNVGGSNLRYGFLFEEEYKSINSGENSWSKHMNVSKPKWENWDSGKGFILRILEFPIPKDPNENYYVSPKSINEQDELYEIHKTNISINPCFLEQFKDSVEINNLEKD